MVAKFEIIKKKDKFFFCFKGKQGNDIMHSDGYSTHDRCRLIIDMVKINAQSAARFDINASDIGRFYFHLRAGNGQILALSDFFQSKEECERAIRIVQSEASTAEVCEA